MPKTYEFLWKHVYIMHKNISIKLFLFPGFYQFKQFIIIFL